MGDVGFTIDHINFIHGEERIDVTEKYLKTEKILQKTGVPVVWETKKTAYQLAKKCLQNEETLEKIKNSNISAIIYITQTPDWFLPAHACKIQEILNLDTAVQSFDLNQGCSGFVQGLSLATKLIKEKETALIITTDRYRSKLHPLDLSTNLVFSDGAAVVLVTGERNGHKILSETHYTNGKGFEALYHKISQDQEISHLKMNGWEIKQYVQENIKKEIDKVIKKAEIEKTDVGTALLHQASKIVLDEINEDLQKYGIKTPSNLDKYGNTTSSTIPSLLYDSNGLNEEEITLLSGFGVGFTISNIVVSSKI
jgi:3-oxoacyl-[acyl-carrier-protein] synthase III